MWAPSNAAGEPDSYTRVGRRGYAHAHCHIDIAIVGGPYYGTNSYPNFSASLARHPGSHAERGYDSAADIYSYADCHGGASDSHTCPDCHGSTTDCHGSAADCHGSATDRHGSAAYCHGSATNRHGSAADTHGSATDTHIATAHTNSGTWLARGL